MMLFECRTDTFLTGMRAQAAKTKEYSKMSHRILVRVFCVDRDSEAPTRTVEKFNHA